MLYAVFGAKATQVANRFTSKNQQWIDIIFLNCSGQQFTTFKKTIMTDINTVDQITNKVDLFGRILQHTV